MSATSRQLEVLRLIVQRVDERGFPPTNRELCESLGVTSTNTVAGFLDALERHGLIVRGYGARAITITRSGREQLAERARAA